jgi:hypothetical protein
MMDALDARAKLKMIQKYPPELRARWVEAASLPHDVRDKLTVALNKPKPLSEFPVPVHIRGDLYALDLCAKFNPKNDYMSHSDLHSARFALVRNHPKMADFDKKLRQYYRRDFRLGEFRSRDYPSPMTGLVLEIRKMLNIVRTAELNNHPSQTRTDQ